MVLSYPESVLVNLLCVWFIVFYIKFSFDHDPVATLYPKHQYGETALFNSRSTVQR